MVRATVVHYAMKDFAFDVVVDTVPATLLSATEKATEAHRVMVAVGGGP